jgi:hypothetical protein
MIAPPEFRHRTPSGKAGYSRCALVPVTADSWRLIASGNCCAHFANDAL